jgi:hypothetical protein
VRALGTTSGFFTVPTTQVQEKLEL